jgi:hypothetical protein
MQCEPALGLEFFGRIIRRRTACLSRPSANSGRNRPTQSLGLRSPSACAASPGRCLTRRSDTDKTSCRTRGRLNSTLRRYRRTFSRSCCLRARASHHYNLVRRGFSSVTDCVFGAAVTRSDHVLTAGFTPVCLPVVDYDGSKTIFSVSNISRSDGKARVS